MAADKTELRVNLDNPVMQRFDAMCQLHGWDRTQGITYLISDYTNKLNEKAIKWQRMNGGNPAPLEVIPPSSNWAQI